MNEKRNLCKQEVFSNGGNGSALIDSLLPRNAPTQFAISSTLSISNNLFRFSNVNLSDKQRFTIGIPNKIKITANSVTICKGEQATITTLVTNGIPPFKYEWTVSGTNVKTNLSSNSAADFFQASTTASITYDIKVTDASLDVSTTQSIVTVLDPTLANLNPVCSDAADMSLSGGSPTSPGSGVYSGKGVNAGVFSPTTAGLGIFIITYTYTENSKACPSSKTITVFENPVLTVSSQNAPCTGGGGIITLSGLKKDSTYSISMTLNGNQQAAQNNVADVNGVITLTGMAEGAYTNIFVSSSKGCKSQSKSATLKDPEVPDISVTTTSIATCGGKGQAVLKGLIASKGYQLAYLDSNNSTNIGPNSVSADINGEILIDYVSAGTYKNIGLTSLDGCKSNLAKATFKDLNAPFINTATVQVTSCVGTGSVIIKNLLSATNYQVSYLDSIRSNSVGPVSMVTDNAGMITLSGSLEGTYKNIQVSINNCQSNLSKEILKDPSKPVIGSTVTLISTCNGSGSILINSGLQNNFAYQVTYKNSDGTVFGPTSITSSGTGQIDITSLKQGAYLDISVVLNNCLSNLLFATLTDRPLPVITVSTSPIVTCGGNGNINMKVSKVSTIYQVKYTDPLGTLVGPSSKTSDGSGVISLAVPAGNYTGITVSIQNCESLSQTANLTNSLETPSASINPLKVDICEGESVVFKSIAVNSGSSPSYQWIVNGIDQNPNGNNQSFTNNQLKNNDVVELKVTSSSSFGNPALAKSNSVKVTVRSLPIAKLTGGRNACDGETVTLFSNGGLSRSSYLWFNN